MSLTHSPKMNQKKGEYLLPGEYVMIENALCLVVTNNWPFLVISMFIDGDHQAPEAYKIVKDEYYHLPAPEFVFAMGALAPADVLEKSREFVVVVDDRRIARIPDAAPDPSLRHRS